MGILITSTTSLQRSKAKGQFIIAMNKDYKKALKIGRYCCIVYLRENKISGFEEEKINLRAMAKVVVDKNLPYRMIAVDQSIRNSLGIDLQKEVDEFHTVKIANLKVPLRTAMRRFIVKDRKIFVRIRNSKALDMEKNYGTTSENVLKLLGTSEGKKINIYNCVSPIKQEMALDYSKKKLIEVLCKYNSKVNSAYQDFTREQLLSCLEETEYKLKCEYKLIFFSLPMFKNLQEINDKEPSMYKIGADSKSIFNIKVDVPIILIDKEYREKYMLNILDCVTIERNFFDIIKGEFNSFGLIFLMSVFTAVTTIKSFNGLIFSISIGISLFVTLLIIFVRNVR